MDDETDRKVGRTSDVEDVRLAFGRFAFRGIFERERIRRKRRREHAEHQSGEVLLDGGQPLLRRIRRWTAATGRRSRRSTRTTGWRGRKLNQLLAAESDYRNIAVLRRNLILADELIGQFAADLELDWY